MTEEQLAALLYALASEAESLRKLLLLCAAAGPQSAALRGAWAERAIDDLQRLASRAEALAEFVVLR
jgi:hypothetical protein